MTTEEILVLQLAAHRADRAEVQAYVDSADPRRRLRETIYSLIAASSHSVIDWTTRRTQWDEPLGTAQPYWGPVAMTAIEQRLATDAVYCALVDSQASLILNAVDRYLEAGMIRRSGGDPTKGSPE